LYLQEVGVQRFKNLAASQKYLEPKASTHPQSFSRTQTQRVNPHLVIAAASQLEDAAFLLANQM
jgi:hypothetical protein